MMLARVPLTLISSQDQAKADLARLAEIRAKRAAAKERRELEAAAKKAAEKKR